MSYIFNVINSDTHEGLSLNLILIRTQEMIFFPFLQMEKLQIRVVRWDLPPDA